MCLAIPYKIQSINGNIAIVKSGSDSKEIDIRLVSGVKKSDWVLVNQKFAVSKISKKDALKMIDLIKDMKAG